jgi:tRNA A37 threonylcarbamoyladenosine modification protein TsaB
MINLFIDATQSYCHLAILNDQIIVKKMKVKTNNNLTEMIVEHIENLLQLVKINHQDVKKILLVVGPGSFTGVRIGVLIAKA